MIALLFLMLATLIILIATRSYSSTAPKSAVEAALIETPADSTNPHVVIDTKSKGNQVKTNQNKSKISKEQTGRHLPDGRSRHHLDERVD
ncbi:MAG: hypothetical protein NC131_20565 [Roseburia sp.]|nr:hypothetical protein [Roseburia sp.]